MNDNLNAFESQSKSIILGNGIDGTTIIEKSNIYYNHFKISIIEHL